MLTSYKNHGNDHFPRVYPINIPFISHWITIKWVFPRLKKPMGFSSFSFFEDSDSEGDVEIRPEDHVFVAASCDELGKLGRRGTYHGNMMENDGNPVWYITHRIHVCYIWGYYSIYIYGYGSIPINTIFSGMNIHKSQLSGGSPGVQGFDTLPYDGKWWKSYMIYNDILR